MHLCRCWVHVWEKVAFPRSLVGPGPAPAPGPPPPPPLPLHQRNPLPAFPSPSPPPPPHRPTDDVARAEKLGNIDFILHTHRNGDGLEAMLKVTLPRETTRPFSLADVFVSWGSERRSVWLSPPKIREHTSLLCRIARGPYRRPHTSAIARDPPPGSRPPSTRPSNIARRTRARTIMHHTNVMMNAGRRCTRSMTWRCRPTCR